MARGHGVEDAQSVASPVESAVRLASEGSVAVDKVDRLLHFVLHCSGRPGNLTPFVLRWQVIESLFPSTPPHLHQ